MAVLGSYRNWRLETDTARIVLHLLHVLHQRNAHRGIASLCIGGGQGGAMLLEKEG